MAPEVLTPGMTHGPAVDIWGVGLIMHVTLVGETPFEEEIDELTKTRICESEFDFPEDKELSQEAQELIRKVPPPPPHHTHLPTTS